MSESVPTYTMRQAIARLEAKGFVVVPRNPTADMIESGWAEATAENAVGVWRDMIDARPAIDDFLGQDG